MTAPVRGVRRQPTPARKRDRTVEPTILRPDIEPAGVDVAQQAAAYADITAETSPDKLGYWVVCPLEPYAGMKVLFRTSNRTKVRMARPQYAEPYELRRKRREIASLRAEQAVSFDEDRDRRIGEMVDEITTEANDYEDQVQRAQCEWLANFVLDFDPWPFKDHKMPNPSEPESYHILYTDFEDLYGWMVNFGYVRALEQSVKNLSRD